MAEMVEVRRSLFAAMVATRLSVGYESYAGVGSGKFKAGLDYLWANLDAKGSTQDVSRYVEEAIALIPEESDAQRPFAAQADNAASALAYALRSLIDRNPQEAAWAARVAYESADNLVIQRADVEIGGEEAENRIIEDPLIQSELDRQRLDVEIAATSALDEATFERLRAECREWGLNFFGRLS
nr:DUF416 family protein [Luteimonas galliterrae]